MELAISYKRFSSPAQARGRSEGRQGDETEAYCTRKGYKLTETFVDRGFSAYTGENSDRGDVKAIVDLARAGRIERGTHLFRGFRGSHLKTPVGNAPARDQASPAQRDHAQPS